MKTQNNIDILLKKADMYEKVDNMSKAELKRALETLFVCSDLDTLSFIYECIM